MHIILWLAHTPQNTESKRARTTVCVCVWVCLMYVCELCKNILKLRRRWLQPPFAIVVCLVLCSWPALLRPPAPCSIHTCSTFICHSFMHTAPLPPIPLQPSPQPPTLLRSSLCRSILGNFYHSPSACHFVYYYDLFWILFYLSYMADEDVYDALTKFKILQIIIQF